MGSVENKTDALKSSSQQLNQGPGERERQNMMTEKMVDGMPEMGVLTQE